MGFLNKVRFTLGSKIFVTIFGIFTGIIYARFLGPSGFGKGVLLLVIPGLLARVLELGLPSSVVFKIGKDDNKKEIIIGNYICYLIFISLLSYLILYLFSNLINSIFYKTMFSLRLCYVSFALTPFIIFKECFPVIFRGLNKIKKYNLFSIVLPAIFQFLFTVIFIILLRLDILGYLFSIGATNFIIIILMLVSLTRLTKIKFAFDFALMGEMLSYGLKGYLANFTIKFNNSLDKLIIVNFLSPYEVGIYQLALKLAEKMNIISSSIGTPLFPELVKLSKKDAISFTKRIINATFWFFSIGNVIMAVLIPFLIPIIYGKEFSLAIIPFLILLPSVIFRAMNKFIGYYFMATGRPQIKTFQKISELILHIGILYLLIQKLGLIAAPIARLISMLVLFLIFWIYYNRESHISMKDLFKFNCKEYVRLLRLNVSMSIKGRSCEK